MKREWKIKFSILMIIAAIIIFGTNYLVLKDTHSIVSCLAAHRIYSYRHYHCCIYT